MRFFLVTAALLMLIPSAHANPFEELIEQWKQANSEGDFNKALTLVNVMGLYVEMHQLLRQSLPDRLGDYVNFCDKRNCDDPLEGPVQEYGIPGTERSLQVFVYPANISSRGDCSTKTNYKSEEVQFAGLKGMIRTRRSKFNYDVALCIELAGGKLMLTIPSPGDGTAEEADPRLRSELKKIAGLMDFKKLEQGLKQLKFRPDNLSRDADAKEVK